MNITKNLKRIRRGLGMTQESLAKVIGVTPQAVSKWERGEGLPDISLVPSIATALGVTTDELFGMGEKPGDRRVQEILAEAFAAPGDSEPGGEGAIEHLRAALRDYPGEWRLWLWLASRLAVASKTGTPEFDEERMEEAAGIFERIAEQAPDINMRLDGICGLAILYSEAGRHDRAAETARLLPERARCYERAALWVLRGAERKRFIEEELHEAVFGIDTLVQYACGFASVYKKAPKASAAGPRGERLALFELAIKAYELTRDFPWGGIWASRASHMCALAADMLMDEYKDADGALGYLERALSYCEPVPGEKPARIAVHKPEQYAGETEGVIPTEIARRGLLGILNYAYGIPEGAASAFAPIRGNPRFKAIIGRLKELNGQ